MKFKVNEHLVNFQKMSYVKNDEDEIHVEKDVIDCSLGINPFGYSNLISNEKELFLKTKINIYPQYPYVEMRKEIAKYWADVVDIRSDNIRLGNGSVGVLDTINKIFIEKNSRVLGYCPQFTEYITDVRCHGGIYEYVELKQQNNYKFDYKEIMNRMCDEHRIIYIDNPNNPTGQIIPLLQLSDIIEKAEKMNICVIVDEAYGDFMSKENSAISLVNKFTNLFVIRTFSKGFGLADLRVGYVVCSEQLLEYYEKVDMPFTVTTVSQYISQVALKDKMFIENSICNIKRIKEEFINACSKIKVAETSLEVPIMVLQHPNEEIDLYKEFLKYKVLTESGEDFIAMGKNAVRLRIPENIEELLNAVKAIEKYI
ncbi:histidinol-phosphate transaminase [Romboutsia sp.]|uniref:pyridoxal phosphate-dependent aminotransferase n=1 Tax=Romboutsia sp. TaxID=1965302 RepID=UPI002C87E70F|nr:histidinol-phosphate transaminase [Romboutsia sp.]HSQ87422.1 histidinol-phosphate transaminase [Romboutsia sp.]